MSAKLYQVVSKGSHKNHSVIVQINDSSIWMWHTYTHSEAHKNNQTEKLYTHTVPLLQLVAQLEEHHVMAHNT